VCDLLGVPSESARAALASFPGVERRFELQGAESGVTVIHDYAHHPTELEATLAAARQTYPGQRLWALFQPHTYSRTAALIEEFGQALAAADRVVLVPIYAAREVPMDVSSHDLATRLSARTRCHVVDSLEGAVETLGREVEAGDVVLVLGAGDIWEAGPLLLERLRAKR
jgi:UDP-N-acetylmuramate--alanine ligase